MLALASRAARPAPCGEKMPTTKVVANEFAGEQRTVSKKINKLKDRLKVHMLLRRCFKID